MALGITPPLLERHPCVSSAEMQQSWAKWCKASYWSRMVNATAPSWFQVHLKSRCSQSICAPIIANCIVKVLRGAVSDDTQVGQGRGTWLWCSLAASPQPLSGGPRQYHGLVESTGSFSQIWVGFALWVDVAWEDALPLLIIGWPPVLCTGLWGQPGRFEEWGRPIYFVRFLAFLCVYVGSITTDIFCCSLVCLC